jgi:PleD family two-component response regulator
MAKSEILILGDGSHSFRTMGWVLEYKGFSIKALSGPGAALEALVKKNYDLIIAKISRNEKDNLTALIQAKKINPLTKVMLITNSLDLAFPLEAYNIDINDYIIMPISAGEFWRRVENCLEGLKVDLTPEDSLSQSASEEKLPYAHLAYDPLVSVTGAEIITAF